MLENATRICEAKFGKLFRCDGDGLRIWPHNGAPPDYAEFRQRRWRVRPADPAAGLDRALTDQADASAADMPPTPIDRRPARRHVKLGGARTLIGVPMLKDDDWSAPSSSIARRFARLPISRSSWCRTSPPRPSSPSRNAAAQRTARRIVWSSRPRPPTCCASSVRRPASWSRCSRPCWKMHPHLRGQVRHPVSVEGDAFRSVAMHGAPTGLRRKVGGSRICNNRLGTAIWTACRDQADGPNCRYAAEPAYADRDPQRLPPSNSAVRARCSPCRCSRTAN